MFEMDLCWSGSSTWAERDNVDLDSACAGPTHYDQSTSGIADERRGEVLSEAEALAALAALLEPLARWLAVTHGPQHRLQVAIAYLHSVPADRDLVQVLCSEAVAVAECQLEQDEEAWYDEVAPCPV